MKKLILFTVSLLCLFFTQTADAASWKSSTIKVIQLDAKGTSVIVVLNDVIGFQGCPDTKTLFWRTDSNPSSPDYLPNFDQMFAMLLLAKANDSEIQVLINGNGGVCNSTGSVVRNPIVRFF